MTWILFWGNASFCQLRFDFFFDFRKAFREPSRRSWPSARSARRRSAAASSLSWRRTTPTSTSSRPETSCTDSAELSDFLAKFKRRQLTSRNGPSISTSCPDVRPSPLRRRRSTWRRRRRTTRRLSAKSRTSPEWPTSLSGSRTSWCCPGPQSCFRMGSTLRLRSRIFLKIENFLFSFVPKYWIIFIWEFCCNRIRDPFVLQVGGLEWNFWIK